MTTYSQVIQLDRTGGLRLDLRSIAETMHRVAVVVDPALAPSIEQLAQDRHVWAVRAPETEETARRVWRDKRPDGANALEVGLTLFNGDSSPERSLLSILDAVELHHGGYSHDPPLTVLEVLGTDISGAVRDALAKHGFTEIAAADHGFIARRAV